MKRRVLFRGKVKGKNTWIFGDLIHRSIWGRDISVIRSYDGGFDSYEEEEVDPETVGQFIGLRDKNGRMIFEGSRIKSGNMIGKVKYDLYEGVCIVWNKENWDHVGRISYWIRDVEVIEDEEARK